MHQNSPFQIKNKYMKILGRGHSTSACGRDPASFLDHFKHWKTQTGWTDGGIWTLEERPYNK